VTTTVAAVLVAAAIAVAGCDRSRPAPPDDHESCAELTGANPAQTEMRRLECALERVVVAIGRDDLAAVPEAMHAVHLAREQTEQAVESGAWKPARGDLEAFAALDESFHHELEGLVDAARANDMTATAAATGRVLGQCQGCHAAHRSAPPRAPDGAR